MKNVVLIFAPRWLRVWLSGSSGLPTDDGNDANKNAQVNLPSKFLLLFSRSGWGGGRRTSPVVYKKNIRKKKYKKIKTVTDKIWSSIRSGCHLDGFNWSLWSPRPSPLVSRNKRCRLGNQTQSRRAIWCVGRFVKNTRVRAVNYALGIQLAFLGPPIDCPKTSNVPFT